MWSRRNPLKGGPRAHYPVIMRHGGETESGGLSLAGQLLVLQLVIILVVLVAVAAVSLAQSAATFNRVEGRRVAALAEQLAGTQTAAVRQPATRRRPTSSRRCVRDHADPVRRRRRSWSPTPTRPRARVDRTRRRSAPRCRSATRPWRRAAAGRASCDVDGEPELVAQVPVLDDGGRRRDARRSVGHRHDRRASPTVWSGSAALVVPADLPRGRLRCSARRLVLLARRVKRQTLGLEPREIAGLAEHREAMLHGIAEGVVALDPQRGSRWSTTSAGELLDLPATASAGACDELGDRGPAARRAGAGARRRRGPRRWSWYGAGRVLVMNRMAGR